MAKDTALAQGYGLIEGPVWDQTRGLIFSDVLNGGVFCLGVDGAVTEVFAHRKGIGGMALHENDGMVVGGRNIAFKPFGGGDTVILLDRDLDNHNVGFNDLTTDTAGRIYAGSLGSAVFDPHAQPHPGKLHLIDLDGSSRVVAEDVRLTNGLGFSPDGATLFHSDSRQQAVFRYDVLADGLLGPKEVFVRIETGAPDGLVVSQDGAVWVALAGGGGVGVYEPDSTFRELIEIPQPMCTSVCFGGGDLKDLYIVTGSEGAGGENRGSIFKHRTAVAGVPVPPARVRT